jgi:hypothetical protein
MAVGTAVGFVVVLVLYWVGMKFLKKTGRWDKLK